MQSVDDLRGYGHRLRCSGSASNRRPGMQRIDDDLGVYGHRLRCSGSASSNRRLGMQRIDDLGVNGHLLRCLGSANANVHGHFVHDTLDLRRLALR